MVQLGLKGACCCLPKAAKQEYDYEADRSTEVLHRGRENILTGTVFPSASR
jgi:hypothetical protein